MGGEANIAENAARYLRLCKIIVMFFEKIYSLFLSPLLPNHDYVILLLREDLNCFDFSPKKIMQAQTKLGAWCGSTCIRQKESRKSNNKWDLHTFWIRSGVCDFLECFQICRNCLNSGSERKKDAKTNYYMRVPRAHEWMKKSN